MSDAELLITGRIATLGSDDPEAFDWASAIAIAAWSGGGLGDRGRRGGCRRTLDPPATAQARRGGGPGPHGLAPAPRGDRAGGVAGGSSRRAHARGRAPADRGRSRRGTGWRLVGGCGLGRGPWGGWPTAAAGTGGARSRVSLWAHDHHALWASAAALAACGVARVHAGPGRWRRSVGWPTGRRRACSTKPRRGWSRGTCRCRVRTRSEPRSRRLRPSVGAADRRAPRPGRVSLDPSLDRVLAAYRAWQLRARLGVRVHLRPAGAASSRRSPPAFAAASRSGRTRSAGCGWAG